MVPITEKNENTNRFQNEFLFLFVLELEFLLRFRLFREKPVTLPVIVMVKPVI